MKNARKLALFVLALGLCGCAHNEQGYHHDPDLCHGIKGCHSFWTETQVVESDSPRRTMQP